MQERAVQKSNKSNFQNIFPISPSRKTVKEISINEVEEKSTMNQK
jgi:hypothetical protein